MKNFTTGSFALLTIIILFSLISLSCNNSVSPVDDLDVQIGQMLMVGFRGLSVSPGDPVVNDIIVNHIGGVVLYDKDVTTNSFDRNIKSPGQLKALVASVKKYSPLPLLVAIDQEGGTVNRLKTNYGFPPSVSEQYLGNINNPDTTDKYAAVTASTLSDMGINVNLAPVVDLNVNPDNPVIGKLGRSFSADPSVVYQNALEMIKVFHRYNVMATLKHFPGHGSSQTDSHLGFTDVTNTWSRKELQPYANLIQYGGVDLIMTAHIFNAHLDPVYPATLSKPIMTGILRDSLHYNGVIISDDMQMKAITDYFGLETAIYNSINAGVDILLFSNNSAYDPMIATKAVQIIKKLISERKISRARIYQSYSRIINLKRRL